MKPPATATLFATVVALCLSLIVWWTIYEVRETRKLERAVSLLLEDRVADATHALGADSIEGLTSRARARRFMFVSEAVFFALVVLAVMALYALAFSRERRLRRDQEHFLTGTTHELKTPLATLRLGLESLQAGTLPEPRRDHYLQAMLQEVSRLQGDVTNLLAAAELSSRPGARMVGDLSDDLREVLAEMAPRFETAGRKLEQRRLDTVRLARDPNAIRMVLRNLLDNALKFSSNGDRITVELFVDGSRARMIVADTGVGMTAEETTRAFERFYRGGARSHVGGTGLGLYLVRALVRSHGGRVRVHSDGPGLGSRFEVEFPIRGARGQDKET